MPFWPMAIPTCVAGQACTFIVAGALIAVHRAAGAFNFTGDAA